MKQWVIFGFLLLLSIDTIQQVVVKIAGNRLGEFDFSRAWLDRVGAEPLVAVVAACYIAAFFTYTWLLKVAPVGPAYAAVHGHVVTVLIISILFFGEKLTLLQGLGCALIAGGIIVLAVTETLEEQVAPQPPPPSPRLGAQ